jgi:hypothetical protein
MKSTIGQHPPLERAALLVEVRSVVMQLEEDRRKRVALVVGEPPPEDAELLAWGASAGKSLTSCSKTRLSR